MMLRTTKYSVAAFLCVVLGASGAFAETKAWGWRGDGTGLFPDADPPVTWGRISRTLNGLRAQAEKPKGEAAGQAASVRCGDVEDWLVIGPFDAEGSLKDVLDKAFVPGEASARPDVGEKLGDLAWRKVQANGSMLDFGRFYKDLRGKTVYAHAYIHSAADASVLLRMKSLAFRIWLNGEDIHRRDKESNARMEKTVQLRKGWNRLLVKTVAARRSDTWATIPHVAAGTAFFQMTLYSAGRPEEYETKGILWAVNPPQARRFSCAQPLIVGDRVIVNADPSFLVCYDKMTGKSLWTRYNGLYEFVTDDERNAHPDLFKEIDPKARRLKELAAGYKGTLAEKQELDKLVKDLDRLMKRVDPKRYAGVAKRQEAGVAGLTSVTDGKFIYTWYANGVVVCHDADGKRIWKTLENEGPFGAQGGGDRHGFQVSPILVGDDVVVSMQNIIGFDRRTGKVKWRIPGYPGWPPPNPAEPKTAADTDHVDYFQLGVWRRGLGFFPWNYATRIANRVYRQDLGSRHTALFLVYDLPEKMDEPVKLKSRRVPMSKVATDPELRTPGVNWGYERCVANVLVHDGLVYTITMGGILRVVDAETLRPVYSRRLGLNTLTFAYPYPHGSGVCASPTLGGKYIYIWGNGGTTYVIKPGRKLDVVARNHIERILPGRMVGGSINRTAAGLYPETTVSSPIFDGKRIYYQAEEYLYCIGEKE